MSTGIIVNGDSLEQQNIKTQTQTTFNSCKAKPKIARRFLSFHKKKPNLDYFSLIKTIRAPNDIISNTEVILSQRAYYPNQTYNKTIMPYPQMKKNQKLYKTHRVKHLTIEDPSKKINEAPLYIESYLTNRTPQCIIGNTIYTELAKRKNEYLAKLTQFNESPINQIDQEQEIKKRNHCIKVNHPNTNYHDMKKIDSIPVANAIACNVEYSYSNISEKERFLRSTENLCKLKDLINNNPDLCNSFLKEYIWRHGIYDDEYYRVSKLVNLSNYLNSDFRINSKKSMKELLIDGLNYLEDDSSENYQKKKDFKDATQQPSSYFKPIKKKALKQEIPAISNIITDMNLQNNLYYKTMKRPELDIINQPNEIVNLLQDEFIESTPTIDKTVESIPIPSSKLGLSMKKRTLQNKDKPHTTSFERLYQKQRPKCDYELIKKHNKLLEYVCYIKAKNNLQYAHLKEKFILNKG